MYNSNQQNYLELQKQIEEMQKQFEAQQSGKTYVDDSGLQKIEGGTSRYGLERPDYYTMRGEDGGLADQFKVSMGDSYTKLSERANAEGDSPWAIAAREQQKLAREGQMDMANRQSLGNMTNAQTQIAMRGGIGGGSSERMAMRSNRDLMDRQQNIQSDFNKSNLDITMQDDKSKTDLLGQVGRAEQMIQQENVQTLRDDYMRQNDIMKDFYSADASAYGAEKTAEAQRYAARKSCFVEGQKIELADGSFKNIENVDLGDELKVGGFVYKLVIGISDHYYDYKGVKVTGSHCVRENGKWLRVEDSKLGVRVDDPCKVYSPSNEMHRMEINGVLFTDYDEVDNTDDYNEEMIMEILNDVE